jgi:hypothetical protein
VLEEHFAKIMKERHPEAMGERSLIDSVAPEGARLPEGPASGGGGR